MRKLIGVFAGAVFGIAFVTHCSTSSGPLGLGDGMLTGDLTGYTGDGLGVGDAHGQSGMVMTASCNQQNTTTTVSTSTNYTSTTVVTYYFADVPLSGLDPTQAPNVSAVACDYSYYGAQSNPLGLGCPATEPMGTTCRVSGYSWPSDVTCSPAGVYMGPGHAVVYCGYKITSTQNNNGTITTNNYGQSAATVYLRLN